MKAKQIRRKLEQLAKQPRISQPEVARLAGIDRSRLNLFLNGHVELRPDQVAAIEAAIAKLATARLEKIIRDLAA